ncbi:MAG: preprotein translocase subunit SecE [Lachnospiraceae bacterium]|nr:preprotein translocase subunit SecE [Lachnospiraceae bacterium]
MSEVKEKKESFFNRIIKGLRSEWIKIIFPSNEQILNDSVTVLICSVIIGLIIFVLDSLIGSGFGFLFNR